MTAAFAAAIAAGIAVLAWIVGRPLLARRRRRALAAHGLTAAQRVLLARAWPGASRLPADLAPKLDALTAVFLGEKAFVGCGGLRVTDDMRLVIAAQACLLLLGRPRGVYDELRSVLVYPSQFVVPEQWHDEDGVVTEEQSLLSGQAWDLSRILLSWEDVTAPDEGGSAYNVVIHEFAHYLDLESGEADGVPHLDGTAARQRWSDTLQAEFRRLQQAVERGEETFLDHYAAQDESEFFAVASEAFFERPKEFAEILPELYREFRGYYGLDPATW